MGMAIPSTDLIQKTFPTPYIRSPFTSGDRFKASLVTVQDGLDAGKIYNQEFQNAKSYIGSGCEHAQHIAADGARDRNARYNEGDPRWDIGYAFQMNQAAALSRRLKKLSPENITPGIQGYIATLDQIDGVWKWLQTVKPIIVKGRKPNVTNKTPEQIEAEFAHTGHCCVCTRRQKLSVGGEVRTRTMVHHGYQMSDYNHSGYRLGKCFGTAELPYEVSCEANKKFLVTLKNTLKDLAASLKAYKASKHESLTVTEYPRSMREPVETPYAKGTPQYEKERESRIYSVESQIRQTKDLIEFHEARVANWKAAKLYDEITDPTERIREQMR
jgi:hypothetical protein